MVMMFVNLTICGPSGVVMDIACPVDPWRKKFLIWLAVCIKKEAALAVMMV